MAREVFICVKCGEQGATQDGICKTCGPTQVMCLDDWARKQEAEQEE
jgi:hypothetical protein